jgi:hypothetical protein
MAQAALQFHEVQFKKRERVACLINKARRSRLSRLVW